MGQQEVMEVLKKKTRGLTSKEISKILNTNHSSANRILKQLYKHGAVSRKEIKNSIGHYTYEYQIK